MWITEKNQLTKWSLSQKGLQSNKEHQQTTTRKDVLMSLCQCEQG